MTKKEAFKLGQILATADGGCPNCVQSLAEKVLEEFPRIDLEELKKGLTSDGFNYWNDQVEDWFKDE